MQKRGIPFNETRKGAELCSGSWGIGIELKPGSVSADTQNLFSGYPIEGVLFSMP